MEFATDASGKVTGNAKAGPFEFKIDGSVKPRPTAFLQVSNLT